MGGIFSTLKNKFTIRMIPEVPRTVGYASNKFIKENEGHMDNTFFEDVQRHQNSVLIDEFGNVYVKVSHRFCGDDMSIRPLDSIWCDHSHDAYYKIQTLIEEFKEILPDQLSGKLDLDEDERAPDDIFTIVEWWDRDYSTPKKPESFISKLVYDVLFLVSRMVGNTQSERYVVALETMLTLKKEHVKK